MTLVQPKNFNPKFEIVSCFIQNKDKFLLLHRQDSKPQGDTWGMPAGKIDSDENRLDAVVREVKEETGLSISNPDYFKTVYVKYPEFDFIYSMFYISFIERPAIKINLKEHKNFKWVTAQEALKMNLIGDLDECIKEFYFK